MYPSPQEAIEALRTAPALLQTMLRDVSREQAQAARGGDEGWSVSEVVCHLRDSEAIACSRMRTLRDATEPVIAGFDQLALAHEHAYATADLAEALAAFLQLRSTHIAELQALHPDQWERVGQHRSHGPVTILNHTWHILWHDAVHLAQIARQLDASRI